MAMSDNARVALDKLKAKGVPVMDWGEKEGYGLATQFVLIHESRNGDETFADIDMRHIKEAHVNGHWINPMGIRHDVHEILAEHNLAHDWQDCGQVVIYDAEQDDVAGWHHKDCDEPSRAAPNSKQTKPPMSDIAFEAFCDLARLGAPVEDWYDHVNRDPGSLEPGTQFVMRCQPEWDRVFADEPDGGRQYFADTDGLRRDIYRIAKEHGLRFKYFRRDLKESEFDWEYYIAFFDPLGDANARGAIRE